MQAYINLHSGQLSSASSFHSHHLYQGHLGIQPLSCFLSRPPLMIHRQSLACGEKYSPSHAGLHDLTFQSTSKCLFFPEWPSSLRASGDPTTSLFSKPDSVDVLPPIPCMCIQCCSWGKLFTFQCKLALSYIPVNFRVPFLSRAAIFTKGI